MKVYQLQISGRIGDGDWIHSQHSENDSDAIERAAAMLERSRIVAGASNAVLWRGDGPTAECVAVWDLQTSTLATRNPKREALLARQRETY